MTEQRYPKVQHASDKVRFLRLHEGLSIGDMAAELRLPEDRLTGLESRILKLEIQDMIRYCDFFGLEYEGFLMDSLVEFKKKYLADEHKMMKSAGYNV